MPLNRIALCFDLGDAEAERLRAGIGDAVLLDESDLGSCDIAFGNPSPDRLATAEDLRWVQLESVGFGEYSDLNWAVLGNRLTLTNLAGFFAEPVAETILAGLLALGRGINRLVRLQSSQVWEGDPLRTRLRLLKNARVVMIGYGSINQRLAELLKPFDCRIDTVRSETCLQDLDDLLTDADIVVCTAPDTPATRGLFTDQRLSKLPRNAVFASFGRGSIVDETALAVALREGRLGGAVLDVTQDEPLPPGHPFWESPNTILTQHSGGGTVDELARKVDLFLANLDLYRKSEPLMNVVDMGRGY